MNPMNASSKVFALRELPRGNRSVRKLAITLVAMLAVSVASVCSGAPLAYYQFQNTLADSDGVGNANDLTIQVAGSASYATGMFGNAFSVSDTLGWGRLDIASAADLDVNLNNFSVGMWLQPNSWSDATVRIITGKGSSSNTNRGWFLQKTNNQIQFGNYTAVSGGSAYSVTAPSGVVSSLPTNSFTHVVGTYDDAANLLRIFVNGIQAGSLTTTATPFFGDNTASFEVGNRGSGAAATAYIGLIDDYYVASDTFSAQQIALTHGLGRLAGVSLASSNEITNVLAAYTTQSFAEAGTGVADGTLWYYSANVGGGNTVGTIGGTVAGGNAFIVLGTDGSGVTMVPEPSTFVLAGSGLIALVAIRKRRSAN